MNFLLIILGSAGSTSNGNSGCSGNVAGSSSSCNGSILLILQRELFKILTEYLHLCPHLLEWVQLNDVAGENCHPLRDPDRRPFITWDSRVRGAPTPPVLIWIQLATEQVKGLYHTKILKKIKEFWGPLSHNLVPQPPPQHLKIPIWDRVKRSGNIFARIDSTRGKIPKFGFFVPSNMQLCLVFSHFVQKLKSKFGKIFPNLVFRGKIFPG